MRLKLLLWPVLALVFGTGLGWWLDETVRSCSNMILRSPLCF